MLAGPRGKLGSETFKMLQESNEFELVAVIDRRFVIGEFEQIPVFTNPGVCFKEMKPDVLVNLTNHEAAKKHIYSALNHYVRSVIG